MNTIILLAAATDLMTSLGKIVWLLQAFSMVITLGAFLIAGVSVISGRMEFVKYAIIGGAISGLAWTLITALFGFGGTDISISPQSF